LDEDCVGFLYVLVDAVPRSARCRRCMRVWVVAEVPWLLVALGDGSR
jgi:hypothetical protein